MRAMMSERDGRLSGDPAYPEVTGWRTVDERAAMIELGVILDRTEPKGGTGPDDPASWYEVPLSLLGRGVNGATRSALARAISSWVTA